MTCTSLRNDRLTLPPQKRWCFFHQIALFFYCFARATHMSPFVPWQKVQDRPNPNTPNLHPLVRVAPSVFACALDLVNTGTTDDDDTQPLWNLFLLLASVPSHAFLLRFLWGGQGSPPQRAWEVRAALAINVLPLVAADLTRYVRCVCV